MENIKTRLSEGMSEIWQKGASAVNPAPPAMPFPRPDPARYLGPKDNPPSGPDRTMTDRESTLLAGRVKRIEQILGATLPPPVLAPSPPLREEERDHLREAAEELYWNELEWEKLTGEERLDEEFLTELAFPGFLAFVRGLLLAVTMPDALAPPRPSPEVVQDILVFLAARIVEFEGQAAASDEEDRLHRAAELKMTDRLVDLVLYLLHRLESEEVAKVEAALASE